MSKGQRHLLWSDTYQSENCIYSAGADGVIAKAVGRGFLPKDAIKAAYKIIDTVQAPDLQYRIDIGKRVPSDFDKLNALGVI